MRTCIQLRFGTPFSTDVMLALIAPPNVEKEHVECYACTTSGQVPGQHDVKGSHPQISPYLQATCRPCYGADTKSKRLCAFLSIQSEMVGGNVPTFPGVVKGGCCDVTSCECPFCLLAGDCCRVCVCVRACVSNMNCSG